MNLTLPARIGLNLVALLGGVIVLRLGAPIFLPLIFAVFLATILWPSAVRLHRFYRLPWPAACTTAVAALVLVNLAVVAAFLLSVPRLLQNVPTNQEDQIAAYQSLRRQVIRLSPFEPAAAPAKDDGRKESAIVNEYLPEDPYKSQLFITAKKTLEGEYLIQAVLTAGSYVSSYLWQFILVLFILLFVLMEGRMLSRRVVEVFGPSRDVQGKVVSSLGAMSKVVRDFLVWRTVVNVVLAVIVGLVYQALGLRQAWVWALLTGVLLYIPYIGPIIAAGPPLLDAVINTSGWVVLIVLVSYTAIIILEGYVVVPLLMGRHMDLNATTVMLACLFWELVWGVPGLFLAMPLMGAIKAICEHVPGWQPWANLMSARDAVPAALPATVDIDKTMVITPPPATAERPPARR
jgi:predicted PurR-regulated permease PerM